MAWIELHQSVVTHKKTLALADTLEIRPVEALGHMASLWLWGLDNTPDGSLLGVTRKTIARAAQWEGDADAFYEALVQAGYVHEDGTVHDWDDYAGKLIDQRKRNAEKQRTWRASHKPATSLPISSDSNRHVTVTSPSRSRSTVPNPTGPTSPTGERAPDKPAARPLQPVPKPTGGHLSEAVKAANVLLHMRCDATQRAEVDRIVPTTEEALATWEACLKEWRIRGHKPGLRGPLDWFTEGIPPGKPQRNGAAQNGAYVGPGTAKQPPPPKLEMSPEDAARSDAALARLREMKAAGGIGSMRRSA